MIKTATRHLEVSECTASEWERAILAGFDAWRIIEKNQGGWVHIDLDKRNITATKRKPQQVSKKGKQTRLSVHVTRQPGKARLPNGRGRPLKRKTN